ncbi:MAG: hypothetical protein KTR25_10530 [Myxococcales bacterium]|nr:hypothetical protein [Myxococcales bacterium]
MVQSVGSVLKQAHRVEKREKASPTQVSFAEFLVRERSHLTVGSSRVGVEGKRVVKAQDGLEHEQVAVLTSRDEQRVLKVSESRGPQLSDILPPSSSIDALSYENTLKQMLEDVVQSQQTIDKLIQLALSGRKFSNQDLLVLQAGVYRCSHQLELMSKLVEKGTSAVKQTLNTQV